MKIKNIEVRTKKRTRKECVDEAKLVENFGLEGDAKPLIGNGL